MQIGFAGEGNAARARDIERVLSITELSALIKGVVDQSFGTLAIQGEVSGIKRHSSGHTYFALKDQETLINAICWRGTRLAMQLEDGMQIVARGRVGVYPARSQYQFIVEEATLAGEGELLKILNERRKKLAELGYFEKHRPIPKYPEIIGVITSPTGAVLQDMIHRLTDRYPCCNMVVWPVNVQGSNAAEQVAEAIAGFNASTANRPDVLIVARGGGSIEDLWPFSEEVVIRAVFDSVIPVVSAIGHETDTTLIDYAADLRAPTPTAAIEFVTPVLSVLRQYLLESAVRLRSAIDRTHREKAARLKTGATGLMSIRGDIQNTVQSFDHKIERLISATQSFFQRERLRLQTHRPASLRSYLQAKAHAFQSLEAAFARTLKTFTDRANERTATLALRLEQSSYRKILERGFCYVTDRPNSIIRTASQFRQIAPGPATIHFQDGEIQIQQGSPAGPS